MPITFGYQYFNFDPEEINEENGTVDFLKAMDLFNAFPWQDQFEGVLKLIESDRSTTAPTIFFFKTDSNYLSISATDDSGFLVHYRCNLKYGELFISNNILERVHGISVEDCISEFYQGELKNLLKLFPLEDEVTDDIEIRLNYNKLNLYTPLLIMIVPVIYLIVDGSHDFFAPIMFLVMSAILFLAILPKLLLNFKYWKNDSEQVIKYNPKSKVLTIDKKGKTLEFQKSQISQVELVRARTAQRPFELYQYLRFTAGDSVFVVTHFTIDPETLLSILNVNFKETEVFYPKLKFNTVTDKEKRRREHLYDVKRKEFLQTCADWETEKLLTVVKQPDHYADYAVSAATEILERRAEK
ncbi:hypothetical protein [Fulvivirga ligni]|uniref:hypothetical protein n=1 Tax=Fulvivirga ligni TaxID=2904246 RepID=UPI001F38CD59|nr:hypothetical protein [Fulvivirga ligni]UII20511.1 hypothetical protein LVD16_21975 [Fulvivirga ligni]